MDEDEDYSCDLTEEELFELTEGLLDNDENNCAKYFRYNFQGNVCFIKIRTKHSSNTLMSLVQIFMK